MTWFKLSICTVGRLQLPFYIACSDWFVVVIGLPSSLPQIVQPFPEHPTQLLYTGQGHVNCFINCVKNGLEQATKPIQAAVNMALLLFYEQGMPASDQISYVPRWSRLQEHQQVMLNNIQSLCMFNGGFDWKVLSGYLLIQLLDATMDI